MAQKPPYDDLETDYFDEEVGSSFLSLMSIGVAFLCVAVFIALAWYAYQDDEEYAEGEIETIYADDSPLRVQPEGESGWQFPDTERQVYNIGNGAVEDMQVEQILPQPSRPAERPAVAEAQPEERPAQGWINKEAVPAAPVGLTDAERRKQETIPKVSNVQVTPEVKVEAAPKKPLIDEVVAAAKSKPKPVPAPVASTVTRAVEKAKTQKQQSLTSNRLQLGAFSSRAEALKNWNNMRNKHAALSGKKAHIEAAEVKGKTYFRVQAYPFDNATQAKAMCVILSGKGQPCFAVKK